METTSFFFFFQAEDGIRDIGVTGVQTCALPICGHILALPSEACEESTPDARTGRGGRPHPTAVAAQPFRVDHLAAALITLVRPRRRATSPATPRAAPARAAAGWVASQV